MGRLRYNFAASLDGYIASPDGSYQWILEDTMEPVDFSQLLSKMDAFIMGRKTYESMLSLGPKNILKNKPRDRVAVVSRLWHQPEHEDLTILSNNLEIIAWIRRAKEEFERDVWLMGGGELCGLLLQEGLVETIEVTFMPVVLGAGIKMVTGIAGSDRALHGWKLKPRSWNGSATGIVSYKYDVEYEVME